MKLGKAPGPDAIPPEAVRLAAIECSEIVTDVLNVCLVSGTFPREWKTAKLILIEKPKKSPEENETNYRPICLINTCGKLLEGVIRDRLASELEEKTFLHEHQFGFRKGKSTLDALSKVKEISDKIKKKTYKNRELSLMLLLDVQNAFNAVPWDKIIAALRKANISAYLLRIIQSYLTERSIILPDGTETRITCGIPQGSVLGPTLWNIFYNEILDLRLGPQVTTIAYADDLSVVIRGKNPEILEIEATRAACKVATKLDEMGLTLASSKTELLILEGRRKLSQLSIRLGENTINSNVAVKYLGVYLDKDLKMTTHVRKSCEKAKNALKIMERITPRSGGPSSARRRTLATIVLSTLLYGAPIWHRAIKYEHYRQMAERINRNMAIRITSAYRTVPTTAILAIAGVPPIDLQILERKEIYEKGPNFKQIARENMMNSWQARWQSYDGWTKVFIKDITVWTDKKWCKTNYLLTQAMTGHGVFGKYLHRIGKRESAACWYCEAEEDSAEHTIFNCHRWEETRRRHGLLSITRDTFCDFWTRSEDNWDAATAMLEEIMAQKQREEPRGS